MRLLIGVVLGCFGLLCIVAGVEGRGSQLFQTVTGVGIPAGKAWFGSDGASGTLNPDGTGGTVTNAPTVPAAAKAPAGTGTGYVLRNA